MFFDKLWIRIKGEFLSKTDSLFNEDERLAAYERSLDSEEVPLGRRPELEPEISTRSKKRQNSSEELRRRTDSRSRILGPDDNDDDRDAPPPNPRKLG